MNYSKFALLSTAGILAVAAACSSAPNSVKTTTESTTRTSGGSVKTTSETKEVGTTLVGTSETKVLRPLGKVATRTLEKGATPGGLKCKGVSVAGS